MAQKSFFSWSGGKDSALALYYALQNNQYQVAKLLTNVTAGKRKIAMHGVRQILLEAQARQIGLPLEQQIMPSQPTMAVYDNAMSQTLSGLRADGFTTGLFGDIFLEDLRTFREQALAKEGLTAAFPLWKRDSHQLISEFITLGFKAVVVCVNGGVLPKSFVGRIIDEAFVADLPPGVDACGENGEYHSFVYDGPIFTKLVPYILGNITTHLLAAPAPVPQQKVIADRASAGQIIFWYQDLLPA